MSDPYTPSESNLSPGFNVAPGSGNADPMMDLNILKTWAPRAMMALRKSNIKTHMANPIEEEPQKSGSGMAKGIISGLL